MKRGAVVLAATLLSACGQSDERSMEVACKELLEISSVNPKKVQVNAISIIGDELKREEAIGMLEAYSGKPIRPAQLAYIDVQYSDTGTPPKQYFVSIDYTDEGGLVPKREKAVCQYYVDSGVTLMAASLNRGANLSSSSEIMDFMLLVGQPKSMDFSGQIKK